MHTLAALGSVERLQQVVVVVSPDDAHVWPEAPEWPGHFNRIACGGATRATSVLGGLHALRAAGAGEADWVLVHDAARCLVTPALIDRLIDACLDDPVGGLLAQPLADTLKRGAADASAAPPASSGQAVSRIAATVPREDLWLAQTPQMFRLGPLLAALEAAEARGLAITDEASAMEAAGHAPRLVPGSPHNIKVTWPEDFALAEALLARSSP